MLIVVIRVTPFEKDFLMTQVLFADQLGPHFEIDEKLLLPEVLSQFSKRTYHRQKAHLILSAIRHRALDENVELVSLGNYRELQDGLSCVAGTSRPYRELAESKNFKVEPARGFASSDSEWKEFVEAKAGKRLVLEDFYRGQRKRLDILMEGDSPAGGAWNFDHDNRLPPPKQSTLGQPEPWFAIEDEIDASVRTTLDKLESEGLAKFKGEDGPRLFPASRKEALAALDVFIEHRLDLFGPYEDAVLKDDWAMSHSLLSAPMNMGLLDPLEVVKAAENAYLQGKVRLASVEGFIRQIVGWRDYVWHLYWHFGTDYKFKNELQANKPLIAGWDDLVPAEITANCVSSSIDDIAKRAWAHHIPRLMILGNIAMQQGYSPAQVNDWFMDSFVDGTPWVMPANVIGMSLYADGGMMSTKPYAAGGAYISKMTNYCGGCAYDPKVRVGENACPVTAGYWNFIHTNESRLAGNHRMSRAVYGMRKLKDLDDLVAQESSREKL